MKEGSVWGGGGFGGGEEDRAHCSHLYTQAMDSPHYALVCLPFVLKVYVGYFTTATRTEISQCTPHPKN